MRKLQSIKKQLVFCILFIFCFNAYSKNLDSLIFNNDFERKVFTEYQNSKKVDPFNILIAYNYTNKSELIRVKLTDFYSTLESNGFRNLNKKKQIKEIYKRVHSTFLQKYSEEVLFPEIFSNGNYNCVTASSLYALVLDHFGIDYQVKKTPVHVYLIADPKGEQIAIESTLPNKGLFIYDERFKKGFVDYLKENKMISENEYRSKSINELFENNYSKAVTIDLIQLTALQYYNKGVTFYNLEDFNESFKCFEKAELLYQDNSIKFMKSNVLVNILSSQNNTKKYNGITLAEYLNANKKSSLSIEYVSDYFKAVSREQVINHPNIIGYKQFFDEFISTLSDSINKSDYCQTYNDLLGYYYYSSADYQNALVNYGNSYKLNSDNIQTKQIINELVCKNFNASEDNENSIDSLEIYIQKFPFLLNNIGFQRLYIMSYGRTILNYYEKGNTTRGEKFLTRFEKRFKGNKILDSNYDLISDFYLQISTNFYQLHFYDNQEDILKRGLLLLPDSRALQSSYKTFLSSKKELIEWAKKNNYSVKAKPYTLDNESITILKAEASKKRNTINLNVDKYLNKKNWRMEYVVVKNNIAALSPKEQIDFTFEKENVARIKDSESERLGSWNYNRNESTIRIFDSKDSITTNLMIYDIDSTMIKSIIYNDNSLIKIISFFKSK